MKTGNFNIEDTIHSTLNCKVKAPYRRKRTPLKTRNKYKCQEFPKNAHEANRRVNLIRQINVRWYDRKPKGSMEELEKSFEKAETYLYKIIDYANKDEILTKEQLEELRRDFVFVRHGPKAHHFTAHEPTKLVSADIFYILLSKAAYRDLAELFEVSETMIKMIKNGTHPSWQWECTFFRRLGDAIDKAKAFNKSRPVYALFRVGENRVKELLLASTSATILRSLRKDILKVDDYNRLEATGTLDTLFPVERLDLL